MTWLAGWPFRGAVNRQAKAAEAWRKRASADSDASSIQRLLLWWDQVPALDPPEAEIHALEERYSLRLPDDFRNYLMATMPEGKEWDAEGTRWFPLADIKSLREECADWDTRSALDSDKLLVFADYLIWCYAWAIDCSETENRGKVALISGYDHYVADSLDEFLDRYLRDDPGLHR